MRSLEQSTRKVQSHVGRSLDGNRPARQAGAAGLPASSSGPGADAGRDVAKACEHRLIARERSVRTPWDGTSACVRPVVSCNALRERECDFELYWKTHASLAPVRTCTLVQ